MSNSKNRSYEVIEIADLKHVLRLARRCLDDMLERQETGHHYASREALMVCLCQGAAQHFVHKDRGVHDWDVVFFFRTNPGWRFPARWRGRCDFGPSRFGATPEYGCVGRPIDVMGRDVPALRNTSPKEAVTEYLLARRSKSAREWTKRPLVMLSPTVGRVVWAGAPPAS